MNLKPCPFCGNNMTGTPEYAIDGNSYGGFVTAVVCSGCSAQGPFSDADDGTSESKGRSAARKLWNERQASK